MYTDVPDQVLRLSMEGAEFALKISGAAAKNIAAALYAVLKDQQRTKGKARITTMLRQQRPMTIYTIKKEDCSEFAKQARGYGVLYAPIPVKKGGDTVDVMVFQDDAARVNRIVERLELTVLDTASIRSELEPSLERERPQGKGPVPEKTAEGPVQAEQSPEDKLLDELLERPAPQAKETGPFVQGTGRSPSGNTSAPSKSFGKDSSERSSVRGELQEIQAQRQKNSQMANSRPQQVKKKPAKGKER